MCLLPLWTLQPSQVDGRGDKAEPGWFQDSSGLLPSKTPGPWRNETWRKPYQLLSSTRSLFLTLVGGGSGVQGWAVPGYPLPGSKVVELGNVCASFCSQSNPQLTATLTRDDQIWAVLYHHISERRVLGWGWGAWIQETVSSPVSRYGAQAVAIVH